MKWSIGIGRIAGIRVELHVTFVLFLAWVAIGHGLLAGDPRGAIAGVVRLILVFACVLLHELGHALAARRYGISTRDIILLPIGGVARLTRMPDHPIQEIVVAIAGPLVNLIIAFTIWLIAQGIDLPLMVGLEQAGLLSYLFAVNVLMLGFNLIPAFPMDGGRVLRAALALRLPFVRATRIASTVGQAFALLFGVVGFFFNPMLLFVALFVFLAASEEYALVETRSSMSGLPARAAMSTSFETLAPGDPLQRAVDLLMAGSQQDFLVLEDGNPIGVLARGDLMRGLQSAGPGGTVGAAMKKDVAAADSAEPLEQVFQRMRERGLTAVPVVHGGRLEGMLTQDNVAEMLWVQDALRRHSRRG